MRFKEILNGPIWDDSCEHRKEEYVGSFSALEIVDGELQKGKYDLYVFSDYNGQRVCIRCGHEGSNYISPGPICRFIQSAGFESDSLYHIALTFMLTKGAITYVPSE